MKKLITILISALACSAQAGDLTIVETETGVTAEYSGPPPSARNNGGVPGPAVTNDTVERVNFLTAQIEQLKKDTADLLKLTGNETEDELTQKQALADENRLQIDAYTNEFRQLTGTTQNIAAAADQPKEEQTVRWQSPRQEKKMQIMELKKRRMSAP
jgi:hypothetical protein